MRIVFSLLALPQVLTLPQSPTYNQRLWGTIAVVEYEHRVVALLEIFVYQSLWPSRTTDAVLPSHRLE